jgi:hypothetical protein
MHHLNRWQRQSLAVGTVMLSGTRRGQGMLPDHHGPVQAADRMAWGGGGLMERMASFLAPGSALRGILAWLYSKAAIKQSVCVQMQLWVSLCILHCMSLSSSIFCGNSDGRCFCRYRCPDVALMICLLG